MGEFVSDAFDDSEAERHTKLDPATMDTAAIAARSMEQAFLNSQAQQAYILVPNPYLAVDDMGLLGANEFMGHSVTHLFDFGIWYHAAEGQVLGFTSADPDGVPETSELYSLGDMGTSGEGMRTVSSLDTTSGTGPAQHAITFDTEYAETVIETNSMGIGYIDLTAYTFDGQATTEKLFFNYGSSLDEPVLTHSKTQVSMGTDSTGAVNNLSYVISNPILYSDGEMTALRYKFGHDATLGGTEERYTSTIKNAIDRSVDTLCRAIETKFRNPMQTFPRTPPLRYNKAQFEAITNDEQAEQTSDFIAPVSPASDSGGSY